MLCAVRASLGAPPSRKPPRWWKLRTRSSGPGAGPGARTGACACSWRIIRPFRPTAVS